ncbi:LppX_LprAFG lipoprotein [Streptomyces violaceus]|uniref:LppX_LprAFG lipoprotein n=1 Tax=Streptomyces violaceus TaxID=1936 RepID=A0ABY9UF25_STRVL|nr:LppX_LprAFG lipoprotein [Streptomyces janthinus]WND18831.1 LppX_LprAFG lipoprotein [Streptomyces janthinus]GGS87706.1 putative lipoprotein [Streptomyces janthinus]
MRTSITAAGLGALLLAAGAVGCGSEQSPEMTPAAAVAEAAKNTEDITSLRYRLSGTSPGEGRVKGEASMRLKPTIAMSMKVTAPDKGTTEAVEIRLVDKAMYLGGGAEMAKEMDGKRWMKFDLSGSEAGKELDQMGSSTSQAEQNPAAESAFLTGAKDVKKVGSEKVDGVETTHYSGTVTLADLRASLKDAKADARKQREKSIKQYEKLGVDKLTMDMWIDGDDHTKQFRMKGDAEKGPLDMTITFLDYNKPVDVKAPPAKEVADLAGMFKELEQG